MKLKSGISEREFSELKLKYENLKAENKRLSNLKVDEAPLAMATYDYLRDRMNRC